MGHRAEEVVPPEPPVKGNGFGELRHVRADSTREASAAGYGRFFIHAYDQFLTQRRKDAKPQRVFVFAPPRLCGFALKL
jgi:hypothetical protein